ncbi:MAG: FtsW/RodA/SpoVE family cell cycle protein [Bacteroidales bacterium]|nr:FtsW/RodA/SpoVE family cell cycle protein [Bacteroidales bacterium]
MKSIGSWFMGDRVIWVVYFFLCIISLVEVFSAASTLAYKSGSFWDPLIKQAGFLTIGTVIAVVIHKVPCRMFKAVPILMLPASMILLLVTLFSGRSTNGASRWFEFLGIQFQPSELAKGAVVITVALILSRMQRENGADRRAFKLIMWVAGITCALILPENLSTACLLFGVVVLMMFIGRVSLLQLGKLFGVLALVGCLGALLVLSMPKDSSLSDVPLLHRMQTWSNRISSHLTSGEDDMKEDPLTYDIDKDAQVAHANIAIASCNFVGKMPGNSVERDFLSQAFSDFIFAIIIEEMGLWGAAAVVFLYVILLFRAGRISSRCERTFPPFLAMGLTLLLVSQAILNMLVAVGLFPVTGQPLPLISRGGTSTLINCVYIGMILSVSRYAKQVTQPQHTQFDGPMTEIRHE